MIDKIKIKVSEQAYEELLCILKDCPEFSHIRFKYKDGCCGSSKVEILLDSQTPEDIENKIDNLSIIYDIEVLENIKEITVVYRNSSFMLKTELSKQQVKDCAACKVGCKSGSGGGCSGCKQ